jgi:prolyl-tRNA synthetase
LIGGMIMTHSDDKGLVLPPRLAAQHVAIVPILAKPESKAAVLEAADKLAMAISEKAKRSGLPYTVGVHVDRDETKQAGWKFFEYELLGTPVRIELGPRDLEKGTAVLTRRDEGKKEFTPLDAVPDRVITMLETMQSDLLKKARAFRDTMSLNSGSRTADSSLARGARARNPRPRLKKIPKRRSAACRSTRTSNRSRMTDRA